jgi:hypothetical protein
VLSAFLAATLVAAQVGPSDIERGLGRDLVALSYGGNVLVLQLFVSPIGDVEACSVVTTNWPQQRAERACNRMVGKKLSQVAKTSDGTPVHGTVVFSLIARPATGRSEPPPRSPFHRTADLTVSVANLPSNVGGKLTISSLVLVDGHGAIIDCSADPEAKDVPPGFGNVACEQVKQIRLPIRTGADGSPVPYITDLSVEFVEDVGPQG